MNKIKFFITLFLMLIATHIASANTRWTNNLRTIFINNSAVIYAINMRTFGAVDYNKNDIIEPELGEIKGTFVNAIPKLKKLASKGINTIYLLPVTKTGKLKALGTAGSLYALDSFDTLNPQLFDDTDFTPDIKLQAKKFIDEAHRLKMHVIVDLPSCGSYDMSLEKPYLFVKDKNGQTIAPSDWADVRLFKVYNDDNKTLNNALLEEYKSFVDLVQDIGADGIRADVAAIKPKEFWQIIINHARNKDPQFLFLAEASPAWTSPAKDYAPYITVEELLDAGFDGFYADWSNLNEIKNASDFLDKITQTNKILDKFQGQKAVIANLATHDQVSPARLGIQYWQLVNWLNVTLPVNPYILDGFPSADAYSYKFENSTAQNSATDDDTYFVHTGKIDIFNFSRAPFDTDSKSYMKDFDDAIRFRYMMSPLLVKKEVIPLKTDNSKVAAFMKQTGGDSIVVIFNTDNVSPQKASVKIPKFLKDDFVMPFRISEPPVAQKGAVDVALRPFEIQVLAVKKMLNYK